MEALSTKRSAAELLASSPESEFTPDELHDRLVAFTPDWLEYDEAVDRSVLTIISDTTIQFENEEISLNAAQVFFLNALRISQGHPVTLTDIADMGYRHGKSNLRTRAEVLLAKLASLSENPIITVTTQAKMRGKPTFYELLPDIDVRDVRESIDDSQQMLRELAELDENGRLVVSELGSICFNTGSCRQKATASMLTDFKEYSHFHRYPHEYFEVIGQRSDRASILPLVTQERLSYEEEQILLAKKENALATFLEAGGDYSDEARAEIIEGVDAFYTLFARNADMLESFGNKYATSYGLRFADSYQRCTEALLDTIARTGFDASEQTLELRLRVVAAIKRAFHPSRRPEDFSAVTIGSNALQYYLSAVRKLRQNDAEPSHAAIAKEMDVTEATVRALQIALAEVGDYETEEWSATAMLEPDFVDEALDAIEREEILAGLLTSNELTISERQILSLYYQVFCSALAGSELVVKNNGEAVEYPRTKEAFDEFARFFDNFDNMAKTLNSTAAIVGKTHRTALAKARIVLQDNAAFDTYGRVSPRQLREEAEERLLLIQKAVELSPDAALSEEAMKQLTTLARIQYLFGSVTEFQSQCGFAPDKKAVMRRMTNAEIIERARQANPEGKTLHRKRLEELAVEGVIPRQKTLKTRFGSTAEFNRQCGFSD